MNRPLASVVILTKNPGQIFKEVLGAACAQQTEFDYEVLVIDSGSSDDTVEYVKSYPDPRVRLHVIPSAEFGHGKTRNLGISLTSGKYVAFLTHDALPATDKWLMSLVSVAESNPAVAGVFGRHIAYESADVFTRRELEMHFAGFSGHEVVERADDEDRYKSDVGYRQFLHFFSDNNSLVRRSVWEQIPYPDVNFAEDQAWANRIIEAGFAKGYSEEAVVFHSHVYGLFERFQRSFDESYAFYRLFGYKLCPSLRHLVRSWQSLSARDIAYGREVGLTGSFNGKLVLTRAVIDNAMRLFGHYVGRHGDRLPQYFLRFLSRDRRVFDSLLKMDN